MKLLVLRTVFTNGGDGLHELVLFELEQDGGFSCSVEPESHNPDLHLWTNVHSVVLKTRQVLLFGQINFSFSLDLLK